MYPLCRCVTKLMIHFYWENTFPHFYWKVYFPFEMISIDRVYSTGAKTTAQVADRSLLRTHRTII